MRIIPLLYATLALTACTHFTGHDFATPGPSEFVPGTTTRTEVIALLGKPDTEATSVSSGDVAPQQQPKSEFDVASVPGSFSILRYAFVKTTAPIAGGEISVKLSNFTFGDGILIGYDFSSNFADHPTDFDDAKLALLKKGETTRQQVEAILGEPTGQAIYPVALKPGESKIFYSYVSPDLNSRKLLKKQLRPTKSSGRLPFQQ